MISTEKLRNQLRYTLEKTDFPELGRKYEGKVRDNYISKEKRVLITTDRISAFDRVLCTLPFKGQVLNQTSTFWFNATRQIIKNHVIDTPDPNVIVARECKPYPVEMVVRGYITGVTTTSIWYNYEKGIRDFCGNILPEGLEKNQSLDKPILTPSTKADKGSHDISVPREYFFEKKLIDEDVYKQMERDALRLYEYGNNICSKNNLMLVDTKYEFGDYNGELTIIDEIHTPDSSRFWIKDNYEELFSDGKEPQKLDKEYVRQWLASQGFRGEGKIPAIPDDVKIEASKRYIQAYEMITGNEFTASEGNVIERIRKNLKLKGYL